MQAAVTAVIFIAVFEIATCIVDEGQDSGMAAACHGDIALILYLKYMTFSPLTCSVAGASKNTTPAPS